MDAQVSEVLGRVMAQRRTVATAADYVRGLSAGVKANCWQLAEAAGHESPYRMQALLRTCRWQWEDLRSELPALALAGLPSSGTSPGSPRPPLVVRAAALAASIASSATTAVRRSGGRTVQIKGSGGIAFPALDRIALTCCR